MESKNKLYKGFGFLFAIMTVIGVVAVTSIFGKKEMTSSLSDETLNNNSQVAIADSNPASTTPTAPQIPPATTSIPMGDKKTASVYKDGTYSATGSYMSPGGKDLLGVTITLADDVITSVTVTNGAGDHTSDRYQEKFISGYKQYVVGKNIADVKLTKVSGASLTPIGFNDALSQIKSKAKA